MSVRLFLIISLIFSFLQGPFLPPVFIEGFLVMLLSLSQGSTRILPALFLGGLIFDAAQNQTLGLTSIIFLVSGLVATYLSKVFSLQNTFFLGVFTAIIGSLRSQFVFGNLSPVGFLISTILFTALFILFERTNLLPKFSEKEGIKIRR